MTDDPGLEEAAPPRPRRKGIYFLPNAVTLAALFSGFYGIVMAMNGRFEAACIAIFVAAVLDGLDGRIARMTNSQSAFGEQMDSLCDMVSFGAAPNATMSERLSICSPNALCECVMRATRPSRLSSTAATKTAMQAASKRPSMAITMP